MSLPFAEYRHLAEGLALTPTLRNPLWLLLLRVSTSPSASASATASTAVIGGGLAAAASFACRATCNAASSAVA